MTRPFYLTMPRPILIFAWLIVLICSVLFAAQVELPEYTQLTIAAPDSEQTLYFAALRNGEPVVLKWHNSIFDLDVTEEFTATNGTLIQHAVTFADPRGVPPMVARPQDLDDLYHTGGPFTVRGIAKPFTHITYRIGEIGNPQFHIRGQVIALKPAVGFGGRVTLTTGVTRMADWATSWIRY